MSMFKHEFHEDSSDEYATPRWFVEPLADALGGFDLDPASGAEPEPHADETYTAEEDGLEQPWFGNVWLNPPFSEKEAWLRKARTEVRDGNAEIVVALLPVDTSTEWFHEYVGTADVLCFYNSRLAFNGGGGRNRNPNFGVMTPVYAANAIPDALLDVLKHRGTVYTETGRFASTRQTTLTATQDEPEGVDEVR